MNKEDLQSLVGKYLNGYKITRVEYDSFIKGQINLFTDTWQTECFSDKCLVKFFIREEPNTAKIYQELTDKENFNLKQALNEIEIYIESLPTREQGLFSFIPTDVKEHILQIIDKALGDEK